MGDPRVSTAKKSQTGRNLPSCYDGLLTSLPAWRQTSSSGIRTAISSSSRKHTASRFRGRRPCTTGRRILVLRGCIVKIATIACFAHQHSDTAMCLSAIFRAFSISAVTCRQNGALLKPAPPKSCEPIGRHALLVTRVATDSGDAS